MQLLFSDFLYIRNENGVDKREKRCSSIKHFASSSRLANQDWSAANGTFLIYSSTKLYILLSDAIWTHFR